MEELDILETVAKVKKVPKIVEKPDSESDEETPKKERSARQIKAFEACLLKKKVNADKRFNDAKKLAEYEKKELEEKVVKKAISIKKKQIKKQAVLDEISDDDTPMEKIKPKPKPVPVKEIPKTLFKFI